MANPNIVSVTGITAGTLGWNLPTGGLVNLIDPDTGYLLKINRIVVANVDGSAAADVDVAIAQGEIYWDGSAEIDIFTLDTTINDDVIGGDGDTLEDLSDQMDVLSSQSSKVLNVYDK